jgi:hypothetical protein
MYPNRWGANQVATINVLGGVLSNSTAVGINLNQSANANNTGTMNLNGGTVQANSVSGANVRLNFNGETLKARQMFPARLRRTTASSCSTPASTGGSFSATNLPALSAGLAWDFNSTSGVLSVVQTVAMNPTNIAFTEATGSLTLTWPSDHAGWRLQVQTNLLNAGLGTNWFDVPNSTATNSLILPMDLMNGSVFYRLVYP